jgi:hypothetical protein
MVYQRLASFHNFFTLILTGWRLIYYSPKVESTAALGAVSLAPQSRGPPPPAARRQAARRELPEPRLGVRLRTSARQMQTMQCTYVSLSTTTSTTSSTYLDETC